MIQAIAAITTLISLVVGGVTLYDYWVASQVQNAKASQLPFRIRMALRYTQLYAALENFSHVLDEVRFVPDAIIGVHYQGLSFAAVLAKIMYKPILVAVVAYKHGSHHQECEGVTFTFDPEAHLKGKRVLIVDNSLRTGATLKMVYDQVSRYTSQVKTLVIHRKLGDSPTVIRPDFVLFVSKKPLSLLR